jgi:uncharacterized membrane protein
MKNKGSVQLDVYSYSFYLCVSVWVFASKIIEQIKSVKRKCPENKEGRKI